MRSAQEIAKELTAAREQIRHIEYMNVADKTQDELADIEARVMECRRLIYRLERERDAFIYSPPRPDVLG